MRVKRTLAVFLAAVVAGLATTTGASATSSDDVKLLAALNGVAGERVALATSSVSDEDSAAQTATVDIPRDPKRGVRLTADGQTTTVGLPDAVHLHNGVKLANGTVVYRNDNGSAQVVVPTAQQGVQVLTIIERADAPEHYAYPASAGDSVTLAPGGGAAFLCVDGSPVALVPTPWAQNASGSDVTTQFTTDGKALSQYVAHKMAGQNYPVVADPVILPAWAIWRLFLCLGGGRGASSAVAATHSTSDCTRQLSAALASRSRGSCSVGRSVSW
jgi:hypothetical protein